MEIHNKYDFDEGPKIESVSFDEATVRKELMTLDESKSPGPDDIPPKLLKEIAAELAKPLSMLFQASFEAGCLPADWKSALITPLQKGGSKTSANNYRPISLISICVPVASSGEGRPLAPAPVFHQKLINTPM